MIFYGFPFSSPAPGTRKSQIFEFQRFAIFLLDFAPHLHHEIESFKPKYRHFHILSIKTSVFMDGVCKIQLLSTKRAGYRALYPAVHRKISSPARKSAIFMDSKRLCIESLGDLVRGTNCPGHGIIKSFKW